MRLTEIQLNNFRVFQSTLPIHLSDINVLIGENNSGKSSIIRAIRYLQDGVVLQARDVRALTGEASISLWVDSKNQHPNFKEHDRLGFTFTIRSNNRIEGTMEIRVDDGNQVGTSSPDIVSHALTHPWLFKAQEPLHFLVPYLSRRKADGYNNSVGLGEATSMQPGAAHLPAKISRFVPSFPGYRLYSEACKEILGREIAGTPNQGGGQIPGIYLPDMSAITIEQMGDGVPSILLLLCHLATSKGKLFLLEEPENDLHPKALKALLDLIKHSAIHDENQFVISTHSNIVVTHLAETSNFKLFRVTSDRGADIPTSTIEEVPATPQARLEVLQELGYALSDFHLYEGWLIFEEASAESICRNYLIPWFAPKLHKLKTISAGGVDKVKVSLEDLGRLVLFTHLQPTYRDRVWVRVDGDKRGLEVVEDLRRSFESLPSDRCGTFKQTAFEYYYPEAFQEEAQRVLAIQNRADRQRAKNDLRASVEMWMQANPKDAKRAFAKSAKDVIHHLQAIESAFVAVANNGAVAPPLPSASAIA